MTSFRSSDLRRVGLPRQFLAQIGHSPTPVPASASPSKADKPKGWPRAVYAPSTNDYFTVPA
jgi:hypothetical protein